MTQLDYGAGWFSINGTVYPKTRYRMERKEEAISIVEQNRTTILSSRHYTEWLNPQGGTYATFQELIDDLRIALYQ